MAEEDDQPADLSEQPEEAIEDASKGCFGSLIIFFVFTLVCLGIAIVAVKYFI